MRTPEEIQKEIDFNAEAQRACETVKNELAAKIAELVRQKAEIEAEQPERKHGDFGCTDDGYARIAIKCAEEIDLMQVGKINMPVCGCRNKMINPIFGNIFDLMKGEDLEEFQLYDIKVKITPEGSIRIGSHTLDKQYCYEFWCKFGQMIITQKKKQCSFEK